eukprot:3030620-Rhodomonas_salina.4
MSSSLLKHHAHAYAILMRGRLVAHGKAAGARGHSRAVERVLRVRARAHGALLVPVTAHVSPGHARAHASAHTTHNFTRRPGYYIASPAMAKHRTRQNKQHCLQSEKGVKKG